MKAVADAVGLEPVSTSKFSGKRTGNFAKPARWNRFRDTRE